MTTLRPVLLARIAAWSVAGWWLLAGWRAWTPAPEAPVASHTIPAAPFIWTAPDSAHLARDADVIRTDDPFRAERRSAQGRYDPWAPPPVVAPPPVPIGPRPRLGIAGLIGPPWVAIVTGIAGRESGTLLRIGEAFGAIRVTAIRRDTVFLAGLDTTWTLTTKRP